MKKTLGTVVMIAALVSAYLFGGGLLFTSCGTIGDHAMERLRADPDAAELLGDDIRVTYGLSWGSSESQGGVNERAAVRIPVAGSKARGVYHYAGHRAAGSLTFSGTLVVGDEEVRIGARAMQDRRDEAERMSKEIQESQPR